MHERRLLRSLPSLLIIICVAGATPARALDQPTVNTMTGAQWQGADQSLYLHLYFKLSATAQPTVTDWFGSAERPGARLTNYKLFVVKNLGTSQPAFRDVTAEYIDLSEPNRTCFDQVPCPSASLNSSDPDTHVLQIQSFSQDAIVPLLKPLSWKLTYLAEITDASGNRLDAQISATTVIQSYDAKHIRNAIKIKSNINLRDSYPAPAKIVVQYTPYPGKTVGLPARILTPTAKAPASDDGIVVWLENPLPANKTNPLQISILGIKDSVGTADDVSATGTITSSAAAPMLASKAFISVSLSDIAAVHSRPTFSATGAFAPLHVASTALFLPGQIRFDPAVNFDVGSVSAKTTNAVTLPSQFLRPFIVGLPKPTISMADLASRKPSKLLVLNPMFGPRLEFDTQYGGTNVMGEGRLEIYYTALFQTADITTAKVAEANPSVRSTLNLPNNGFSITPYFQYDGGGHVNQQSISNTTARVPAVNIPTYSISRVYLGLQATGQLGRNTIVFDGSYIDLINSETVPYSKSTTVLSRSVSSWQPHFKGAYNVSIDQAGHFAGSVAWENGRAAPSFQYLNKVTIGFRVMY